MARHPQLPTVGRGARGYQQRWASVVTTAQSLSATQVQPERVIDVRLPSPQRLLIQVWIPASIAFPITMRMTLGAGGSSYGYDVVIVPVVGGPSYQLELPAEALTVDLIAPVGQTIGGVWAGCAPVVPMEKP